MAFQKLKLQSVCLSVERLSEPLFVVIRQLLLKLFLCRVQSVLIKPGINDMSVRGYKVTEGGAFQNLRKLC